MKTGLSLSARWALYIARYARWTRATYVLSLAVSLVLFATYYLGDGSGARQILWPAIFFLFLGILSFERSGFSTLLQSKDAEIAELRGKIGTPA
jgi:hypothetical protein